MAYDLFRDGQQKKTTNDRLSNALKAMLKVTPENRYFQTKDAVMRTVVPFYFQVLFNFVMFEKFEVLDLLVPAADALWSLICCHQVRELYCHNGDDDDGFGDDDFGDYDDGRDDDFGEW